MKIAVICLAAAVFCGGGVYINERVSSRDQISYALGLMIFIMLLLTFAS